MGIKKIVRKRKRWRENKGRNEIIIKKMKRWKKNKSGNKETRRKRKEKGEGKKLTHIYILKTRLPSCLPSSSRLKFLTGKIQVRHISGTHQLHLQRPKKKVKEENWKKKKNSEIHEYQTRKTHRKKRKVGILETETKAKDSIDTLFLEGQKVLLKTIERLDQKARMMRFVTGSGKRRKRRLVTLRDKKRRKIYHINSKDAEGK